MENQRRLPPAWLSLVIALLMLKPLSKLKSVSNCACLSANRGKAATNKIDVVRTLMDLVMFIVFSLYFYKRFSTILYANSFLLV